MAARKNLSHDQKTRDRIKTSQLINRLQSYANGKVKLETGQVRAIEALLKKTLPDLSAITVSGDPDNPLIHKIERVVIKP